MTFEHLITQNFFSFKNNILTDGWLSCTYQEIPLAFANFDTFFAQRKVYPFSPLAFEGINSVPSALTLLYLLSRGYSFILLPPSHHKPYLLPKFCQYQLIVHYSDQIVNPEHYAETCFTLEKNAQFCHPPLREKKLYLRTSGSMGNAKIVVHAQDRLLGNVLNCLDRFQLESSDKIAIPVPIFHMYGLGAAFLPAILAGSSIDLQDKSNILKYLERERQFNPNIAFLTPSLCEMLVKGRRSARPYKLMVTAGDRVKEESFRALDECCGHLVSLYGSTEMGAVAAALATDSLDIRATTAGTPMDGVDLCVRELDTEGQFLPGELYCQHQYGFECYVDEEGHLISQAPQWYKTGDLANIHPTGHLQVLGRSDNSINRSGYLVHLSDIEKTIENIENIEKVVVLAIQGESARGQRMIAFCVPCQGSSLDETQVRDACFKLLPHYAIPEQVHMLESLPTLPSGKIDRETLRTRVNKHD